MKYVIILYLCSFVNKPVCYQNSVVPLEFNDYNSCILQGYVQAHNLLSKELDDVVNEKLLHVKFECKPVGKKI